ncbi:MAG: UDP-4-amino-4,6-dideoxy-N-acetyl-beta-L-altrosamine transaminase [Alphaproteobacteria bacterium]|nr:UDP-4-amino-4,6-dideoxy-N-acetyl-beta-L-altrosamine transaminase [Alphaproteobacteria bacterium]MCB9694844.1 UDP-4-amino-4,6-dideoxy-N-acetyl-beta-L-altrosamine transaminase [Alphaproteobacteria bacterium]
MSEFPILPYGRQWVDDDDIRAVVDVLRGDWLTQGPAVTRFEEALHSITGAPHVRAVSNGTAALHLAALAAGVGPGDVGLVSAVTFAASANCIRYAGGTPSLVDVDPDTGLLDLEDLAVRMERHVAAGDRVRAVVPVSFTGAVPRLDKVQALARTVDARVIEDAAHSLGTTYTVDGTVHRSASCDHTDMAILSFHPVKHITSGEGGAVTTGDGGLAEAVADLRSHGITKDAARLQTEEGPWWYEQQSLGFNYRICDIQCALGESQARKLPDFVARRREIAARYDAGFAEVLAGRARPLRVPEGVESAYHLYVMRVDARDGESLASVARRRLALFRGLMEHGIRPQVHYIPLYRHPDYQKFGFRREDFPGSEALYASCISLPMFPRMADADVDRVVDLLDTLLR